MEGLSQKENYLKLELDGLIASGSSIIDFLQEAALDGIWFWDLEQPEQEYMSPRFWELFGYSPEEKKHLASEWQEMIHPDDLQISIDNFEKHCADPNHPYDQVVRYTHQDGSTVWVRCRGVAIRDAEGTPTRMLGAHTDVTQSYLNLEGYKAVIEELKQANAIKSTLLHQLEEKNRLIEAINDVIGDGVWDWNIPNNQVTHNQQWLDYMKLGDGYLSHPVEMFSELVHSEDQDRVMRNLQNCLSGEVEVYTSEHRMIRSDGEEIWVRDQGKVIERDAEGKPLRMVGAFSDISGRKRIEVSQKEIAKAQDEFLATMSHELRTPLTSIIGNSEYLLDEGACGGEDCTQSDAVDILQSIHSAGKSQLALVNDILDMSKIHAGRFTIDDAPYNFAQLLRELECLFEHRAKDVGLDFKIKQQNEENFLLIGDSQRIVQVLMNLIGNALKFTAEGGVTLTTQTEEEKIIFTVEDTGIGISTEILETLFSRFGQADSSISKRFGGTGLGLYISKNLAEMMGGTIEVSSLVGEGSTFRLILPYKKSATGSQENEREERHATKLCEQLSGHVLLAEDTLMLQQLERRILEKMGLKVTIANHGVEAVEMATAGSFDVILMDMQMPEMDGIEACSALRAKGIKTPVIAVTANVMQRHREAFSKAGCDGFIGKPINNEELRKLLKKYL